MNASLILALLSLALTLIFGLVGIYTFYIAVKPRYPGRITFIREGSIGLFDSIVRNLPELSVLYKGHPVSPNLVLLKGVLQNTGSIDITESMIVEKLALKVPEGYRWLASKIVSSAPSVTAAAEIRDESELVFDLGLFRCNEHIRFEALAEVPSDQKSEEGSSERLNRAVMFNHRIANTRKVNTETIFLKTGTTKLKPRLGRIIIVALNLGLVVFSSSWQVLDKYYSVNNVYLIRTDDYNKIEVKVTDNADGTKTLKGVDSDYSEQLREQDFYLKRYVAYVGKHAFINIPLVSFLCSLTLTLSIAALMYFLDKRRTTRINNLLKT